MKHKTSVARPRLPGTYVSLLADVVARWHVSPEKLLAGSGIAPAQLQEAAWHLDFHLFDRLVARAVKLTGEPGLGFHMGLQMTVSCHGQIGFAALVAKNLGEAIQLAQEFITLRCPALRPRLEVSGATACVYLDQPLADYRMGEAGVTFLLIGLAQMAVSLTGQRIAGSAAELCFARGAHVDRFEALLPLQLRYSQPCNRLTFPASAIDLPLVMSDPLAARQAREDCKRMLSAMGARDTSTASLVRALAYDEVLGFSGMQEVARKLHLSERSLQRRLTDEGETFTSVIDGLRREKALALLRAGAGNVAEISELLGYADVANFNRAFKRWTGKTPGRFRRSFEIALPS